MVDSNFRCGDSLYLGVGVGVGGGGRFCRIWLEKFRVGICEVIRERRWELGEVMEVRESVVLKRLRILRD